MIKAQVLVEYDNDSEFPAGNYYLTLKNSQVVECEYSYKNGFTTLELLGSVEYEDILKVRLILDVTLNDEVVGQ